MFEMTYNTEGGRARNVQHWYPTDQDDVTYHCCRPYTSVYENLLHSNRGLPAAKICLPPKFRYWQFPTSFFPISKVLLFSNLHQDSISFKPSYRDKVGIIRQKYLDNLIHLAPSDIGTYFQWKRSTGIQIQVLRESHRIMQIIAC